ncbi:MAG: YecR family lipoprotein [Pseudomonadota bacterium]
MTRSIRTSALIFSAVLLLNLTGCVTSRQWTLSGGDRDGGVVRVSYEYPEFHQPALSDEQAMKIATSRCNGWGYHEAEPIAGQIRQCSNMDGSNCDLWTVTREYQCTVDTSYAARLSK